MLQMPKVRRIKGRNGGDRDVEVMERPMDSPLPSCRERNSSQIVCCSHTSLSLNTQQWESCDSGANARSMLAFTSHEQFSFKELSASLL